MVLKRQFREGSGEGSSEFPNRAFNRPNAIPRDEIEDSLSELVSKLEPFLRNCVSEEVERGINSYLRRSLQQTDSCPGSRVLQLHFTDKLPSTIFTGCRVETEDSSLVKVFLYDARTREIITSGPLSSTKVTLVVLDGDFNKEDREDWTQQEFNKRTLKEREGKRPLMTGSLVISLKGGVGNIEDVSFTDNSSWTRSGKFQLGAITSDGNIREGISNVFKVKDQRGESYNKHDRPSSVDDVWRLKRIAKDGASHKRLSSYGIYSVKDLLRMYVTNPSLLRKILGSEMSNKKWETIVRHANACLLDENELYQYKAADGTLLVLNSIYELVGVLIDGEHYLSPDMLSVSQKLLVENMKKLVYKNLNYLAPMSDQSVVACPLLLPSLQTNSYSSPTLAAQNVTFPVEEDQLESQFDPGIVKVSPAHAYAYGVEAGSQFKVSAGETSHQVVFWKWITPKMLGLVTQTSVFHWSIDGDSEPVKMFDRTANLSNNQIINYRCDASEKWLVLIGIAPGSPEVPGNDRDSILISFATKTSNAGQVVSKLHVIELGAQPGKPSFTKKQADLFFPPDFADDFPVAMQISQKYSLIYVITKLGLLFVYDLETATAVYRNRISPDPIFLTSEASSAGGQLNNLELAVNLAKRGNLPGAENLGAVNFALMMSQMEGGCPVDYNTILLKMYFLVEITIN